MDSQVVAGLIMNHNLWIIILATLYAFSLYVYFFPTPMFSYYSEGFEDRSDKFLSYL